ncbi:MAG: UDP-glucose 4-epimerase GalE, partial [Patescibacteria group bacterium]
MSKILVTGAGGYIGSIAVYQLLQKGYEIVGLDNFSRGFREPLELLKEKYSDSKLRYYNFDIKDDLSPLFEKEKGIDAVIHYAAFLSVDESMKKPEDYFSNNVAGSQNLLSHMLENNIKKIIFSSTCAVYGNAEYIPIDENHKTEPTNPYGASKVMVENILKWYNQLKDMRFVSLRYFNVCGASDDGLIGDSKKPSVHLMQNAIRGALGLEPFYLTFSEVDTDDKSPVRDYCNVEDLNEAHILALDYLLKGGNSEIINLGTGTGNSVLEIIEKVEEETGAKIDLKKGAPREGEYAKAVASIQKAKNVLGWEPK